MSASLDIAVPLPVRRHVGIAERLLMTALLADTCVILYGMVAGFWLRFFTPLARYGIPSDPSLSTYAGYIACGTVMMLLALMYYRLYEKQTLLRYRHVSLLVLKSAVMWFAAFTALSLLFKFQPPLSRGFVLLAGLNVSV